MKDEKKYCKNCKPKPGQVAWTDDGKHCSECGRELNDEVIIADKKDWRYWVCDNADR